MFTKLMNSERRKSTNEVFWRSNSLFLHRFIVSVQSRLRKRKQKNSQVSSFIPCVKTKMLFKGSCLAHKGKPHPLTSNHPRQRLHHTQSKSDLGSCFAPNVFSPLRCHVTASTEHVDDLINLSHCRCLNIKDRGLDGTQLAANEPRAQLSVSIFEGIFAQNDVTKALKAD